MNKGYVYLLIEVNQHGEEAFKVGISKNDPNKRLHNLQTGNSNKITLLKVYESNQYKMIERMLHARYSIYQTGSKNEWFYLPNEVVLAFLNECKKADETISFLKKYNSFYN